VTGVTTFYGALTAKQLGLLRELVPAATSIAFIVNPGNPIAESTARDAQEAARTLGEQIHISNASTEAEIDTAFATLTHVRAGALVVGPDAFLIARTIKSWRWRHVTRYPRCISFASSSKLAP
jgi:ABC-type uncharacterized transport system substrate-binding protein